MGEQGIYRIRHLGTDAAYVGQAHNFHKRWVAHKYKLRLNRHPSKKLQMFWNSYGLAFFVFEILERIENVSDLNLAEQRYIDAEKILLNASLRAGGGPVIGRRVSEEFRKQMSALNKGRKHTPETRAAMSAGRRGKPRVLTPEGRAKVLAALRGNKWNRNSNRTHCIYGHPLPTELRNNGKRKNCVPCANRRSREYTQRHKANLQHCS